MTAILVLASALRAQAGEYGTEAEAKAMLDRAVNALRAEKEAALSKFTNGLDGFKDRDLYPFCGGSDGYFTAHPAIMGQSLRNLRDKTGKPLGEEMYKVAEEGKLKKVTYMWPRPGTKVPVPKVTFVTRIGDQVCGVGYYSADAAGPESATAEQRPVARVRDGRSRAK